MCELPVLLACVLILLAARKVSVHVTSSDVVYVSRAIRAAVRCVCDSEGGRTVLAFLMLLLPPAPLCEGRPHITFKKSSL